MSRYDPTPLDDRRIRHLKGAAKAWRQYLVAQAQRKMAYGTIGWRKVKGEVCLVQSWSDDLSGIKSTRSFGPRSFETEERKRLFERARIGADQAVSELGSEILRITLASKNLGLGRLDDTAAAVLRQLREEKLYDLGLHVVDSSVIAGYEAQAGVLMPEGLESETGELELSFIQPVDDSFLDLILKVCRRVDPSFRRATHTASILGERLKVRLHWRQHNFEWLRDSRRFDKRQVDLIEDAIDARPISTIAIAKNGMPVEIVGPDPRNFAVLHYASEVANLELGKERSYAVGRLVEKHWPDRFAPAVFEAFPEFAANVSLTHDHAKDVEPSSPRP